LIKLQIGDIVLSRFDKSHLVCGSGYYHSAVVVSLRPFVLISENAEMMWCNFCDKQDLFRTVGTASPDILAACMKRLYFDYPNFRLHAFMETDLNET